MIEIEGLTYTYPDGQSGLRGVSFHIPPGQKVVLLGSNGSGKTTLLHILDGLLFPQRGRYSYDSQPVTERSLKDRSVSRAFRKSVVLLFQNPDAMLFNPTVYDEIAFGCRQLGCEDIDERVRLWAEVFGISHHLDRPPFRLSNGEKQKVCLASLMVLDPETLLLDEPTSSLDPRSTGWLIEFLQDLEVTTIVATHNLSLAGELGDRTLVLSEDHQLIHSGSVRDLLKDEKKLVEANLVHIHRHRHGDEEHRHYHIHDWD